MRIPFLKIYLLVLPAVIACGGGATAGGGVRGVEGLRGGGGGGGAGGRLRVGASPSAQGSRMPACASAAVGTRPRAGGNDRAGDEGSGGTRDTGGNGTTGVGAQYPGILAPATQPAASN